MTHPQQYGPPQPPPYGQQPAQPYAYGQGQGYARGCEVCGAQPAAAVTVRAHQGMIVVMRTVTRRGVLCRTGGLAVYRKTTSDTLVTGRWGLFSLFVTPFVVLGNVLGARSALRRLPEPYGALRPLLDPGRRVLRRAPAMLVLTPPALLAGPGDEHAGLSVGDCVANTAEWPSRRS
ncbi:hypothetical protein [Streptomyces sp. NPDC002463]|uniref:hypothetical protein n=1 Tax=Streptomyces sp. NPDC002463 TaxID=3364645 RepID=UPI0036766A11